VRYEEDDVADDVACVLALMCWEILKAQDAWAWLLAVVALVRLRRSVQGRHRHNHGTGLVV
jgi:hypothetical protein